MNVLSLFDGMSCGQIALNRANIPYEKYFASEIDKYAIKVTQHNYPNTIQLGDVTQLYDWHLPKIDLLLGGSPCTGFSFAGKMLNFDDPRSALFFWYVNALRYLKPKYFLFENVRMKKEIRDVISKELGVEPIEIDSALVSAQSRRRLYWTNIPNVNQPEDKQILLVDVLESSVDNLYLVSSNWMSWLKNKPSEIMKKFIQLNGDKAITLTRRMYASWRENFVTGVARRNQVTNHGTEDQLNVRNDGKANCVVSSYPSKLNQVGFINDECTTIRRLTPVECERLQTVPMCDIIDVLWQNIMQLSIKNKITVPVETLSGKQASVVGNAENRKLQEFVKLVTKSIKQNDQPTKFIVHQNADTKIEIEILKCTNHNHQEVNMFVDNVENPVMYQHQKTGEDFVPYPVSINIIEVKIIVDGEGVYLLKDRDFNHLQNGEMLLDRCGNEIIKPVDDVVYINQRSNEPTIYTTLNLLVIHKKIEQIKTILSYYAGSAITGHTLKKMLLDGCWICPKTGDIYKEGGYTSVVSNTQRYEMLGNGWTIDVIAHILKSMKWN